MLRTILSITGKPGLYKLIANSKNMLLVEELATGRRFPVSPRDKVVSLGDVAMYTSNGDTPLGELYEKAYAHLEGKQVDVKSMIKDGTLRSSFEAIVPDYDAPRVYDNDIKKFFTWYNALVGAGFDKFVAPEEDTTEQNKEENA